jgi:hypothetical protein
MVGAWVSAFYGHLGQPLVEITAVLPPYVKKGLFVKANKKKYFLSPFFNAFLCRSLKCLIYLLDKQYSIWIFPPKITRD